MKCTRNRMPNVRHRHEAGSAAVSTRSAACLRRFGATLLAFACTAGAASAAHPGDIDGGFGQGGFVTNDFFGTDERIFAVAPMRDGRFVATGKVVGANASGDGGSENVAVARYLPNGALDPSFGTGGLFHLDVDGASDEGRAVRVLSDNSVLVGGTLSTSSHSDYGVVKLKADGSLDTTFGEPDAGTARRGYVRLDIGGVDIHDNPYAMAVQRNGKIVLAGITRVFHDGFWYGQVAVARFTAEGVLDTTFAAGQGYVVLAPFFGAAGDTLSTIALDQAGNLGADDRIVVGGYTSGRNTSFLARLTADGAIDTTFNGTGRVTFQAANSGGVFSGLYMLAAARLTADGHIVVVGEGNDRGMAVMRFNANGALDTTFGQNGRSLIKFSGGADEDIAMALALQGNGRIVAAGSATNRATGAAHQDFFVGRWNADGTVDTTFGEQGLKVAQVSTVEDGAYAVAVEISGDILAGGYTSHPNVAPHDFALLRLFGDPDRIFANGFDAPPGF
ncbi:hypothetical protein [Dokdonella sp.]|uniref:hypothetical protein n=1 Tax=Dokdonella sp. TaxID=2291710 RepID=UPI002F3EE124